MRTTRTLTHTHTHSNNNNNSNSSGSHATTTKKKKRNVEERGISLEKEQEQEQEEQQNVIRGIANAEVAEISSQEKRSEEVFLQVLLGEYALLFSELLNSPHSGQAALKDILLSRNASKLISLTDWRPFVSNEDYMRLQEVKYILKNLKEVSLHQIYQGFSKLGTLTTSLSENPNISEEDEKTRLLKNKHEVNHPLTEKIFRQQKLLNYDNLAKRRMSYDHLYTVVAEIIDSKLSKNYEEATKRQSSFIPFAAQLCNNYRLSPREIELFHFMIVIQGSQSPFIINSINEDDYFKRTSMMQRVSGMAETDIETFCDQDRAHCKDGIITCEEDHGVYFNLRCSRTCVQILYGRPVSADDFLKISQTALEPIINSVFSSNEAKTVPPSSLNETLEESDVLGMSPATSEIDLSTHQKKKRRCKQLRHDLQTRDITHLNDENDEIEEDDAALVSSTNTFSIEPTVLTPYNPTDQLEYLEEGFELIAALIKVNAARLKDDMKKEGTKFNSWDLGGEIKGGKRELQAKVALLEKRMEKRVSITRQYFQQQNFAKEQEGSSTDKMLQTHEKLSTYEFEFNTIESMPRLEVIADRLGLDAFEKKLVLLLVGRTVSPVVKALLDALDQGSSRVADDVITVGQALAILCKDFKLQIANRKYFYRSSRLLSHGIVTLTRSRWHQGSGDLTDQRIIIDRRVLDWTVGLDSEINELVEGSDLYEPHVNLEQVVLPEGKILPLIKQCRAYDTFRKYRKEKQLDSIVSYGNGLVILLCGKSGTGKTMTVNAIAKDLRKKVLLVDFGSLSGRRESGGGDMDADLRGLFRESHMSNAILFFDECDSVFRSRDRGGDRLLNSLLTEIERHEGIVFLATNRAHELDEAMHRRITCVINFDPPDYNMRHRIWRNMIYGPQFNQDFLQIQNGLDNGNASAKLDLADDVDLSVLSIRYELTGGFIKNALLAAILNSIHREKERILTTESREEGSLTFQPILTQNDLEEGCQMQMRGSINLQYSSGILKLKPTNSVSKLFLPQTIIKSVNEILQVERTKEIVFGKWGGIDLLADDDQKHSKLNYTARCTNVLFAGPAGSGKKTLLRAMAYDLKKTVHFIHFSMLFGSSSKDQGEAMTVIENLLHDAKLANAIVGIDGFEHLLDDSSFLGSTGADGGWKLHLFLGILMNTFERHFSGLIILLCNIDQPHNLVLQRDFATKLFSLLKFTTLSSKEKSELWKKLLPAKVPLAEQIDFVELAKRYELNGRGIANAIARACSFVASRISNSQGIVAIDNSRSNEGLTNSDLFQAAEAEISKTRSSVSAETVAKMFL